MRSDLAREGKNLARKALIAQLLVSTVAVVMVFLIKDFHQAMSAAAGCIISILPNSVFAIFAFRYAGARQNQLVARSFSQGAKTKLAISFILFVIAFKGLNVNPLALFGGFAIATVSYWLTLLLQHKQ